MQECMIARGAPRRASCGGEPVGVM